MAETFMFGVATPGLNEDAVDSVRCYESADGMTGWALVDTVNLGTLVPVDDVYTWASALADSTKYHQLVPVSAAGIERAMSPILPPRPTDPTSFIIYFYAKDLGLAITSSIRLQASTDEYASTGNTVFLKSTSVNTDADGYAALTIPADIGEVIVTIGKEKAVLDTTGRGATAYNLAGLFTNT